VTVEALRSVVCRVCGTRFELTARNVRGWHSRGLDPVCAECRHPSKPVDAQTRVRMRRWWVEESGLSLEELREIAGAIAGPLD
jgi:hypothetical protein